MESRIKQLRENRGLIQEILASELGITQQMLSKYERDVLLLILGYDTAMRVRELTELKVRDQILGEN